MENAKLEMLSTMVTSALAKIIDENSNSGSEITVKKVLDMCTGKLGDTDDDFSKKVDFRIELIRELLVSYSTDVTNELSTANMQEYFRNATYDDISEIGVDLIYSKLHDSVLEEITSRYLRYKNENDSISDFLESNNIDFLSTESVSDWFDEATVDDVIDMCPGSLEDDLKEHFFDECKEDFKEQAKDAIDSL